MSKNETQFHIVKLKRNKSLFKAIKILNFLGDNSSGATLSEICSGTSIDKATALRFLVTLEEAGFVEKRDGSYFLGIKLFELGNKVPVKKNIIDRVHLHLKKLADMLNETMNLAELCFGSVNYLDKIESPRSLRISTYIGAKLPIHCTALGKSIVAFLPEEKREVLLQDYNFEKMTSKTITNKEDFRKELMKIQEQGYSVDDEEFEEGLRCVAVPLSLEDLNFYGAISISAPSQRLTDRKIPEVAEILKRESEIIKEEFEKTKK